MKPLITAILGTLAFPLISSAVDDSYFKSSSASLSNTTKSIMRVARNCFKSIYNRTVRSGDRMRSESIREFIYPTEYDPAEIPSTLTGPIDENLRFTTSANATAFEMRPTGFSVEMAPVLVGKNITLNLAPEIVRLIQLTTYGEGAAAAQQPLFETLKLSTMVTVPADTSVLLAMHSLESARAGEAATEEEQKAVKNRRILVFVTSKVNGHKP